MEGLAACITSLLTASAIAATKQQCAWQKSDEEPQERREEQLLAVGEMLAGLRVLPEVLNVARAMHREVQPSGPC